MAKALVLLSGGLDSMLAAKVLMEQGVEVTGVSFKSYFFGTGKAKKVAEQLGIKFLEADFSEEHLAMVKNPKHGYGKNMNPCIDCHALMLTKARGIMEKENYDFVATGEVLGERPMSQNAEALKTVEKESGLIGRLIRPLSAKLLPESDLEKSGLVIRGKLLDICGRSRQRQLALVKKYGIKEYSSPGGGCLLTDPAFSEKLIKLFGYWPESDGRDIELLKNGRIFWLKDKSGKSILLVIGRERLDNEHLDALARPGDMLIKFFDLVAGPTSILRIKNYPPSLNLWRTSESSITNEIREIEVPQELKMSEMKFGEPKSQAEIINLALMLTGHYATKSRGKKVELEVRIMK